MKKMIVVAMAVATLVGFSGNVYADKEAAKEVQVGISDAYIPGGFNSGSDAFVVVNGIFPNGCYRWSRSEVTKVGDHTHEVRNFASVQPGLCVMVLVPFNKEVRIGRLESGRHDIRFVNGDGTYIEKQMVVE